MTTENTATESVREEAPLTPQQVAEEFVKESSVDVIIEELVNNYNAYESMKKQLEYMTSERDAMRTRWATISDTIEQLIKSHVGEGDDASVDDLKELADDLDIELSKTLKVTMTVSVEVDIEVPIDFDEDTLDESDFEISAEFTGCYTDVDCSDDWDITVDEFNCEEE